MVPDEIKIQEIVMHHLYTSSIVKNIHRMAKTCQTLKLHIHFHVQTNYTSNVPGRWALRYISAKFCADWKGKEKPIIANYERKEL